MPCPLFMTQQFNGILSMTGISMDPSKRCLKNVHQFSPDNL
jgi:hypothetical protein